MLPLALESGLISDLKAHIAKSEPELKLESEKLVVSWFICKSDTTVLHILVISFKYYIWHCVSLHVNLGVCACLCVYMISIVIERKEVGLILYFCLKLKR